MTWMLPWIAEQSICKAKRIYMQDSSKTVIKAFYIYKYNTFIKRCDVGSNQLKWMCSRSELQNVDRVKTKAIEKWWVPPQHSMRLANKKCMMLANGYACVPLKCCSAWYQWPQWGRQ